MGKKLRLKEQKRREADRAVARVLKAHSKIKLTAEPADTLQGFSAHQRQAIRAFRSRALRAPEDWRCAIKSRLSDRRFIELVRFTFARYAVPQHLEKAWIDEPHYELVGDNGRPLAGLDRTPADLRAWYILVTQGGSLYKDATQKFLSKAETHHFLTAPREIVSARNAFWYAVARAQTDDRHLSVRVGTTRLAGYSVAQPFWRDAARFFVRNPASITEMNDLIDFFRAAKEEDGDFSLKGRSLEALRRRMEEWHRALRKQQTVGGGAWSGSPLPDVDYEVGSDRKKAIWRFRQIKTGNDLFREGQRMHHCVITYKGRCLSGDISIWSLASEYPIGSQNRGVTMEVRKDGAIVQCRGFANRLPYGNEVTMAKRWARDHGLAWRALPA